VWLFARNEEESIRYYPYLYPQFETAELSFFKNEIGILSPKLELSVEFYSALF
jgi:hypothetical protein